MENNCNNIKKRKHCGLLLYLELNENPLRTTNVLDTPLLSLLLTNQYKINHLAKLGNHARR